MLGSRSVGGYVASEIANVIACRTAKPQSDPAALVLLGHGSNGDSIYSQAEEPVLDSTRLLADSRYVVAVGDLGSTTHWGNDTAVTRVGQLKSFVQGSSVLPVQAKAGGVFIFAKSMGTLAALNFARANPTLVKAIASVWPCIDLNDMYVNNRGGFASEISTVYGGAPPSSKNPAANTSELAGIPILLMPTSGDTVTPKAQSDALKTALPSTVTVTQIGTGDHGTQTSFSMADVISFFASH